MICQITSDLETCIEKRMANMDLIEIRQLLKSELKQAVQIWLEASIITHHFIDPAFWESKVKDMETVWLPAAENTAILKGKQLVGFSSLMDDRLAAIFIQPSEQSNGYGTLLLNEVKQRKKRLELTVYEKNHTAITFYVKHGFRKTEKRKDPATGEKEVVMVWS